MSSVIIWMSIAAFFALITYVLYRNDRMKASTAIAIPLIAFYSAFVLTITLIDRIPTKRPRYELVLFWSYKAIQNGRSDLISEVFWNVVLFIPLGILFSLLLSKRKWISIVLGMLLSSGIELTQLILHRGLFEFDDIFHNTLGTFIGFIVYLLVSKLLNKLIKASSYKE